jgi:hypothetical protein
MSKIESEPERVTAVWVTDTALREFRNQFDPAASVTSIAVALWGTFPTAHPADGRPGACFVLLGRVRYVLLPNLKPNGQRKGYGKYKLANVERSG